MWFVTPFVLILIVTLGLRKEFWTNSHQEDYLPQISASTALEGLKFPGSSTFEVHSRTSISEQDGTLPDTAIVIFLGGIGCSANQIKLLQYWSEEHVNTGFPNIPVLALYADPLLGLERSIYEALILRRVSQAKFPFFVSQDTSFSLRAMVENQVIARVFNPMVTLNSPDLAPAVQ